MLFRSGDLLGAHRPFVAGPKHAPFYLRPVIGLSVVILLDNDQRNRLHLLICGKSFTAFVAYPAAADGIVVLGRSRIDYSGILMAAKRTFHSLSPPIHGSRMNMP